MKLLTVTINDNIIETLDFEREKFTNSFILPSDSQVSLITVPMDDSGGNKSEKGVFVQNTEGRKCFFPCKLEVTNIECDEENLIDRYEVKITFDSEHSNGKPLTDETCPHFKFEEGVLYFENIHPEHVSSIEVTVTLQEGDKKLQKGDKKLQKGDKKLQEGDKKLQEGDKKYSVKRTIFLSPANQVEDVILDFGSEATQLSISNRGAINNVRNLVPLFEKMWEELGEPNKKEDMETCMQRDASDKNLYRSRFFVKKKIKYSLLQETKASGDPKNNEFIKLLTLSKDGERLKESYIPLPNTKIASFGGVDVDNIDIETVQGEESRTMRRPITEVGKNFFYRSSINAFLRKAVNEIKGKNLLEQESVNKIRLISFHILMPNVYDYCKIHEMLEVLKKDIQEIVQDVNGDIIGFDVTAVSESDASLLGNVALSEPDEFPAGRYLILDAGRGTLDFSIVKHDNESKFLHFQNLYRDGIIGAGNALTYAMLLVILEGIINNEDAGSDHTKAIQNYIFSDILGLDETGKQNGGGDSAKLVELMELVDKYKIMYSDFLSGKKSYSKKGYCSKSPFKELRLVGLVKDIREIVDNRIFIEDSNKYLERSMQQLVDAVKGRLKDRFAKDGDTNRPDYVVFAGRGFMFKPFKDMMYARLKECFHGIKEKHFSAQENNVSDKNVCLVIANYLKDGDYDTRLLGQPYMLHSKEPEKKNENKQEKDKDSVYSRVKRFLSKHSKVRRFLSKYPKVRRSLSKCLKAIGDKIKSIVGNTEKYKDVEVSVQKGYRAHKDMNLDNFSKGVRLHADYSNDQILIGNIRHKLPNSVDWVDKDFDLFFANGMIWLRPDRGKAVKLEDKGIDFGGNRIFESLFPYVNVKQPEEVAMPSPRRSTYKIPETEEGSSTNEKPQNDGEGYLK